MLIFFLVLIRNTNPQQTLCYAGPGDVYAGDINITARGDECETWSTQTLINTQLNTQTLNKPIEHNFCRVYLDMSSRPYCVYKGQKQSCDVPACDLSTLRFQGSGFLMFRNKSIPHYAIVAQQVNLYFRISEIRTSAAVLVRVESQNDQTQHFSLLLHNGFLKLVVSLHSYVVDRFVFGGPVGVGEVHYVSVNRYKEELTVQLNQTSRTFNITSKETTFLVSPYLVRVGENYFGCMTGLSVGTWLERSGKLELLADKPLMLFTGRDMDDFSYSTLRQTRLEPKCACSHPHYVKDLYRAEPQSDYIADNSEEAVEGLDASTKQILDQKSIIIISTALALILSLAVLVLICVKINHHHRTSIYNLEVM